MRYSTFMSSHLIGKECLSSFWIARLARFFSCPKTLMRQCFLVLILDSGQQTKTFVDVVDKYAQLGLHTLCFGWRELESEEYTEWSLSFKEANSALIDREWKVAEICQRLEHSLEILGVSTIEDRL